MQGNASGFFAALFDFSFDNFITIKLTKVIYIIGIVASGLGTLGFIISGFTQGFGSGLMALIVGPLLFLLWVVLVRIGLELIIAVFKIAENTSALRGKETPPA